MKCINPLTLKGLMSSLEPGLQMLSCVQMQSYRLLRQLYPDFGGFMTDCFVRKISMA